MFGMGGSEILVILVIALLFLGPDKLPQAAKQISKGIRDIKKQSRSLQQQIENDENIGGAIRDLKSALRGDELPSERAKPKKPKKPKALPEGTPGIGDAAVAAAIAGAAPDPAALPAGEPVAATTDDDVAAEPATEAALETAAPRVTLPPVAGEPDPDVTAGEGDDDVADLIRPAAGTVAKGSEPKHG